MSLRVLKISVIINVISIVGFAVSMPFEFDFGSYLFSIFIALSYMIMICGFNFTAGTNRKLFGNIAAAFCAVYVAVIIIVYYTQLTTVRLSALTPQTAALLDFKTFGLMFNYDLLGYSMMSLASFFAGLTITCDKKADKVLKVLLLLNIIFFFSCFITPLMGIFNFSGSSDGTIILEFWCAFFCPISLISYNYFKRKLAS